MKLEQSYVWKSSLVKGEFYDELRNLVAPVEKFRLISKISGAGIVTRVLGAPESDRLFWGKLEKEPLRIVQNLPSINLTPYQPIVYITVTEEEEGSSVQLILKPHHQASMFALLEYLGAVLCMTAGLIAFQENPLGLLGIFLGGVLAIFPTWRAKRAFASEQERCLSALQELPLQWVSSEVSVAGS